MLKATSSIVNVSQITGVLPVVNGGTGVTTSTGTGNTVLSAAPTLSGNVTLSTGNLIVANGQGIDFSATPGTGTSELLNDYEEGTFSFTLLGGSGTFTSQTNRYTKIGRVVTVNFDVTINAISGSGADTLVGLPFACLSGAAYAGSIGFFSSAANAITFATIYASTTTLYLIGLLAAGTSVVTWNALGNGTRITGTIVYATT